MRFASVAEEIVELYRFTPLKKMLQECNQQQKRLNERIKEGLLALYGSSSLQLHTEK